MANSSSTIPSSSALRAFEAAATHGNFTHAAAALHQTQGAISHQIRELETRLGVKLFAREARGISLTEAGAGYLPFVREALDRLRAGARALCDTRDTNVLTVSMSPNFAAKWLVPRLGAFYEQHADVDLRISAAMQHVNFEDDGIDVAIRHGEGDWPHLHVTRLCREEVFPVYSAATDQREDRVQCLTDLRRHVLLHDRTREGWEPWLRQFNVDIDRFPLDKGPVFNQTSLAIDAAVAGQGVALARSALAALDLAAGRLVRPLTESVPAKFAYWIVCPKPSAGVPKVARFREWLHAEVARDEVALQGAHPAHHTDTTTAPSDSSHHVRCAGNERN